MNGWRKCSALGYGTGLSSGSTDTIAPSTARCVLMAEENAFQKDQLGMIMEQKRGRVALGFPSHQSNT